jgi:hypothetical protein
MPPSSLKTADYHLRKRCGLMLNAVPLDLDLAACQLLAERRPNFSRHCGIGCFTPMTPEQTLKQEFDAEDGSFMLRARIELVWDEIAFRRLTSAMYDVAVTVKDLDEIPRWIALGFWHADTWIRDWTSHPDFPRPESGHRERAYELIHTLAYLLFMGERPYQGDALQKLAKG